MTAPAPVPGTIIADVNPPVGHPLWCNPAHCSADPAGTLLGGYRAGFGGQHLAAPAPLDLRAAVRTPAQTGTAYLMESGAPWTSSPYLWLRVGDTELSLPGDYVGPVLDALAALMAEARAAEGVAR